MPIQVNWSWGDSCTAVACKVFHLWSVSPLPYKLYLVGRVRSLCENSYYLCYYANLLLFLRITFPCFWGFCVYGFLPVILTSCWVQILPKNCSSKLAGCFMLARFEKCGLLCAILIKRLSKISFSLTECKINACWFIQISYERVFKCKTWTFLSFLLLSILLFKGKEGATGWHMGSPTKYLHPTEISSITDPFVSTQSPRLA